MIYPGECSMCTWEERVFCCCWVECSVYICYSPFVLKCHWSPIFPYGFFCLESLSIIVSEVLKSPTISALLSISACRAVNIYLIYVVALMFSRILGRDWVRDSKCVWVLVFEKDRKSVKNCFFPLPVCQ